MAGYHLGEDSVLILDVARFKYPPYWVKINELWNAMAELDKSTQHTRGYFLISGWEPRDKCDHQAHDHSHHHSHSHNQGHLNGIDKVTVDEIKQVTARATVCPPTIRTWQEVRKSDVACGR